MNPIQIIQGGKISFIVRLLDESTGDPFDLTTLTAITTCFMKSDGTELTLSLGSGITVLNAVLGKLQISLTSAQTALLAPVPLENLELTITLGSSDPFKQLIPSAYVVVQSLC